MGYWDDLIWGDPLFKRIYVKSPNGNVTHVAHGEDSDFICGTWRDANDVQMEENDRSRPFCERCAKGLNRRLREFIENQMKYDIIEGLREKLSACGQRLGFYVVGASYYDLLIKNSGVGGALTFSFAVSHPDGEKRSFRVVVDILDIETGGWRASVQELPDWIADRLVEGSIGLLKEEKKAVASFKEMLEVPLFEG